MPTTRKKPSNPWRITPISRITNVVARGNLVYNNMNGNPHLANPPVDMPTFRSNIDSLATLIPLAAEGTKKVIAQKNKQRHVVIRNLKLLGRYVEVTANGDLAIFQTSGFPPASTTRKPQVAMSESIRKIAHGTISGQVRIWVHVVRNAASYEVRYAPVVNNVAPTTWSSVGVSTLKTPVVVSGLTPVTLYAFQARALVKNEYTDWSDSVTFVVI
jgi:hypothetical protein